jgi:HEPN domain-containing protein
MKNAASEWLDFAAKDFQAAKKLSEDEHLTNIVLFHCQQTIEKALKALLSEHMDSIPRIHSVYTLFEKLPAEIIQKLNVQIEDLEIIDTIYTDSRYPSNIGLLPSGLPTKKELNYILELTEKIFSTTSGFLNRK